MRAAVEVEAQAGDVVAEALLEVGDEPVHARLGLRDREVAVRLARAGDRRGADAVRVEREAELAERRGDLVDARLGDSGEYEVLLTREAHVAADVLGEI